MLIEPELAEINIILTIYSLAITALTFFERGIGKQGLDPPSPISEKDFRQPLDRHTKDHPCLMGEQQTWNRGDCEKEKIEYFYEILYDQGSGRNPVNP